MEIKGKGQMRKPSCFVGEKIMFCEKREFNPGKQ
jgi:hypothetical protein